MVNHKAIRRILIILAVIFALNLGLIAAMMPMHNIIVLGSIGIQIIVGVYLVVIAWKLLKLTKNEE